jgi:hypothetical protein
MKLNTTITLQSKLYPEVSYTVRTLSEGRRQQLTASIADATYEMYDLVGKANAMLPTEEGVVMSQEDQWKRKALVDQIDDLTNRTIAPAWIKTYVKTINGLEIDGEPATIETFLSDAPSDMFAELVNLIKGQAELSPEETKN